MLLLILSIVFLSGNTVDAKTPKKLSFKKKSVTLYEEDQVYLKVVGFSQKKAKKTLTFTSSRPKVAEVSASGILTAKKAGKTRIRVTGKNRKAAACMVTVKKRTGVAKVCWTAGTLQVITDDVTRYYTPYYETAYEGYLSAQGCVHTAVAVAASAFGGKLSPLQIHQASSEDVRGEIHAVRHMKDAGKYPNLYNTAAISVRTAGEILKNSGIPAKAVTGFTTASAEKEIKEHLRRGKPVIVKTNNNMHNGLYMTNGHHAMVLLGLNAQGKVFIYDTAFGRLNASAMGGTPINMTLKTLIEYHMTSPVSGQKAPYVMSLEGAGGYILVG